MTVLRNILASLVLVAFVPTASATTLPNPIVFVTQPPIPRELNSSVSNTFLSVVSEFGNQQPDTAHAARGGDLWLMTTNLGLVNLTRKAGFGVAGIQAGGGIDVRDPAIHWSGDKVLFLAWLSELPTNATDTTVFFWQLYELTNLDAVIADTNTIPVIAPVAESTDKLQQHLPVLWNRWPDHFYQRPTIQQSIVALSAT